MFSAKCANTNCAGDFDYRHGRLFRFHEQVGRDGHAGSYAVRHFWLCDPCSQIYALQYVSGGAVLVELEWSGKPEPRAASCTPRFPQTERTEQADSTMERRAQKGATG
jgi:hypothetical protein